MHLGLVSRLACISGLSGASWSLTHLHRAPEPESEYAPGLSVCPVSYSGPQEECEWDCDSSSPAFVALVRLSSYTVYVRVTVIAGIHFIIFLHSAVVSFADGGLSALKCH